MEFDTTFEIVFFPCKDIEKQDPRILDIIKNDAQVERYVETYTGIMDNGTKESINPDNIEENDGTYIIKNPNKTFTDSQWYWLKRVSKTRKNRNYQQTEQNLIDMGLWPIVNIQKGTPRLQVYWNSDFITSNFDEETGGPCGFMAFMIDSNTNKLAGVAKANIVNPIDNPDDFPRDNPNIPLDRKYVYISKIDIHPHYRGKKLCKPFLKRFMNKFTEFPQKYTSFYIENASDTGEGIPACFCYVKAGQEEGYNVFYVIREKNKVEVMSTTECVFSTENPFELPRTYFYIKPMQNGGFRKKRKTRRQNARRSNARRSNARRSNARRTKKK